MSNKKNQKKKAKTLMSVAAKTSRSVANGSSQHTNHFTASSPNDLSFSSAQTLADRIKGKSAASGSSEGRLLKTNNIMPAMGSTTSKQSGPLHSSPSSQSGTHSKRRRFSSPVQENEDMLEQPVIISHQHSRRVARREHHNTDGSTPSLDDSRRLRLSSPLDELISQTSMNGSHSILRENSGPPFSSSEIPVSAFTVDHLIIESAQEGGIVKLPKDEMLPVQMFIAIFHTTRINNRDEHLEVFRTSYLGHFQMAVDGKLEVRFDETISIPAKRLYVKKRSASSVRDIGFVLADRTMTQIWFQTTDFQESWPLLGLDDEKQPLEAYEKTLGDGDLGLNDVVLMGQTHDLIPQQHSNSHSVNININIKARLRGKSFLTSLSLNLRVQCITQSPPKKLEPSKMGAGVSKQPASRPKEHAAKSFYQSLSTKSVPEQSVNLELADAIEKQDSNPWPRPLKPQRDVDEDGDDETQDLPENRRGLKRKFSGFDQPLDDRPRNRSPQPHASSTRNETNKRKVHRSTAVHSSSTKDGVRNAARKSLPENENPRVSHVPRSTGSLMGASASNGTLEPNKEVFEDEDGMGIQNSHTDDVDVIQDEDVMEEEEVVESIEKEGRVKRVSRNQEPQYNPRRYFQDLMTKKNGKPKESPSKVVSTSKRRDRENRLPHSRQSNTEDQEVSEPARDTPKVMRVPNSRRPLYSLVNKRMLIPGEELEDDPTEDWLVEKMVYAINDFIDVSDEEKEFSIKWNLWVMKPGNACTSGTYFQANLIRFCEENQEWFREKKLRFREIAKFWKVASDRVKEVTVQTWVECLKHLEPESGLWDDPKNPRYPAR